MGPLTSNSPTFLNALQCPGSAAACPGEPEAFSLRAPISACRYRWEHHGTRPGLGPPPVPAPAMLQPGTKLRPRLPALGRTMTEQFEWAKGKPGSLTYLVEPALGGKNGNVAVKTSAGATGHGAPLLQAQSWGPVAPAPGVQAPPDVAATASGALAGFIRSCAPKSRF